MDQHRLDRIRLLSARFHELQGLRVALAGACMALVVGGYLIATPQPTNNGAMIAMLVSFVPVVAGMPRLNRYYATTFGRQVWSPSRKVAGVLPVRLHGRGLVAERRDPGDSGGGSDDVDRRAGLALGRHS